MNPARTQIDRRGVNGNGKHGSRAAEHTEMPSHNRDAESALLSAILQNNSLIALIIGQVAESDFYVHAHQLVYRAILWLYAAGRPADVVTVPALLINRGEAVELGGDRWQMAWWQIHESAPNPAHYKEYIRIIKAETGCRNLIRTLDDARNKITAGADLAEITAQLAELGTPATTVGYRFAPIDSAAFAVADFRPSWLIKRLLVKDQPCILGGPKKALKTSLLIDLALSLGSGSPFLGQFTVYDKTRTVLISGESGKHTIQETARRVARAKDIDLATADVLWDFRLPQLASAIELAELGRGLRASGAKASIIDPLYLTLLAGQGEQGLQATNLYDMGPLLLRVADTCLNAGATPILAHHAKRGRTTGAFDPLELDDLAFSGVAEFARQWMLLSRRQAYEPGSGLHRLWFSAGGSIGHGGLWAIDVDEGRLDEDFGGRRWGVTVKTASDSMADAKQASEEAKRRARQERNRSDDDKLLECLDRLDPDRKGFGCEKLIGELKGELSKDRTKDAVERLRKEGIVEYVPDFVVEIGSGATKPAKGIRRPPRGPSKPSDDHRSEHSADGW